VAHVLGGTDVDARLEGERQTRKRDVAPPLDLSNAGKLTGVRIRGCHPRRPRRDGEVQSRAVLNPGCSGRREPADHGQSHTLPAVSAALSRGLEYRPVQFAPAQTFPSGPDRRT
jgi:hypothetical protein